MDSAETAWSSSEGTQWGVWQEQGELQTEWKPSVILGADACLANSAQEEDKVLRMRTAYKWWLPRERWWDQDTVRGRNQRDSPPPPLSSRLSVLFLNHFLSL